MEFYGLGYNTQLAVSNLVNNINVGGMTTFFNKPYGESCYYVYAHGNYHKVSIIKDHDMTMAYVNI